MSSQEVEITPKKNRHVLTPLELQQEKLEKLFEKIEKPVFIPEPPKEKKSTIQAPKDFIRNVSGNKTYACVSRILN